MRLVSNSVLQNHLWPIWRRFATLWQGWKTKDKISAVSAACAIFVLFLGILQYRSTENWKRSEFVAAQIKDFNSDKINQAVLLMMDYSPARVELFPEKSQVDDRYVDVTFDMLIEAINKDKDFWNEADNDVAKERGYQIFRIKILFEHFITSLARFDYFLKSGAMKPQELCADFGYPVGLMTGAARKTKQEYSDIDIRPFSNAVKEYLKRWNTPDIYEFLTEVENACTSP